MSSNFCSISLGRHIKRAALVLLAFCILGEAAGAQVPTSVRFANIVTVTGDELALLDGSHIERFALLACQTNDIGHVCAPVPFQVDEVDATGQWVLDQGPQPNADESPGVLDANDRLLFMAADAGERVQRAELPSDGAVDEISVRDPLTGTTRWAYAVACEGAAPRSTRSYVAYDPVADRVRGQRVTLGFRHGVPGYLALNAANNNAGANLLDRFKVRATATFLWGLVRFSRNEDDVSTEFVAWRQGPIRVIRRQRQWVRIGWGIHSPTFGSYTYFYRDFAELPVGLHLNFPPTYFFGDIHVRALLDFRDLRGWSLLLPNIPEPIAIDRVMTKQKEALNQLPASWFALQGPLVTLVQMFDVGSSLASLRRRLVYDETTAPAHPPEDMPGEEPGIGYQLDQWQHVGAGAHQLASTSYALPPDVNVRHFMAARRTPLQVTVRPLH
jgi:hypothetical protein